MPVRFIILGTLLTLFQCVSCGTLRNSHDGTVIRVMAYNIHHGVGMDDVIDLERIAGLIESIQPDLVAIQNVDSVVDRTNDVDQINVLADLTGLIPAFGRFMPYQGGAYGIALLSRLPVLEIDNLRLPDGNEPRSALRATVLLASGDTLEFTGIHFYRTDDERMAQARSLEDHLGGGRNLSILAGDFNSTPGSAVLEYLSKTWTLAEKGEDHSTFSMTSPEREIDYVFYRPEHRFSVINLFVIDEPAISDHRPIVVDFAVNPQ